MHVAHFQEAVTHSFYCLPMHAANFQEAVITHSFYKVILENVEKHITNEVLVEVAFEIFIILSLNSELCIIHNCVAHMHSIHTYTHTYIPTYTLHNTYTHTYYTYMYIM